MRELALFLLVDSTNILPVSFPSFPRFFSPLQSETSLRLTRDPREASLFARHPGGAFPASCRITI